MGGAVTRTLVIPRVGVGGRRTDTPSWGLDPSELAAGSQDAVLHEGALRRRRGYRASTTNSSATFEAVYRATFGLTGLTLTYVTAITPGVGGQPPSANILSPPAPNALATALKTGLPFLPRAMYRDQLLFTHGSGREPMVRVGGNDPALPGTLTANFDTIANQSIVRDAGGPAVAYPGQYVFGGLAVVGATRAPRLHYRVLAAQSPDATLEDFRTTGALASFATAPAAPAGYTYPCVEVYSAGTISIVFVTSIATGVGTKWADVLAIEPLSGFGYGCLVKGAAPAHYLALVSTLTPFTHTQMLVTGADTTNQPYGITARCPFTDVCVHNDSLYGVGVAAYPSRVYVAPADWNMTAPPGAALPYDPSVFFQSSNTSDFLLDFIDLPTREKNVAILATDGPRLVLREGSVYGIHGDPPNLDPELLHSGDGCIDIRSAISVTAGAFWAGRDGVYQYARGRTRELTAGWMRNEWRALVDAGIEYCATGVDGRHLVVSIKTADAKQEKRTYLYDLEADRWLPEITNLYPRHMFTANITGEVQQLLCVDDAKPGKVLNLSPALNLSGPARDEAGTGPNFRLVTGDGLAGSEGVEGELHVLETSVHANVRDSGGTTTLSVQATHGGALRGDGGAVYGTALYGTAAYGPDGGKSLGTIAGDADERLRRAEFRVNRSGRRFGLTIEETTASATVETVEMGEAVVRVRDKRRGS